MKPRPLGRSGLQVAPLVFGGNVFGWTADEAMSFRLLDRFMDADFNMIDTADAYSRWIPGNQGGESETIIGKWMAARGNRERVLIATKFGMEMGEGEKGLSRAYMTRAVERSLDRLQTDYIDLYQAHRDDADTPMEETLEAFSDLIRAGKVRVIGASNFSAERLSQALETSAKLGLPRYESLQPNYNLYDRAEFEDGPQRLCESEDVGVITYFSLASGFLTGKYRTEADLEGRPRAYRVRDMLNARGLRILDALDAAAKEAHASPAQVSLAWLLTRPGVTAPIASATTPEQLEELLGAVDLVLDPDSLSRLDRASA